MSEYALSSELLAQTELNAVALEQVFSAIGTARTITIDSRGEGEDDFSASTALRRGTAAVLEAVTDHTDVVLDVSSVPRSAYLSVMLGLLQRLIPSQTASSPLAAIPPANRLLMEYKGPLLDTRETPFANVLYANEGNRFRSLPTAVGSHIPSEHARGLLPGGGEEPAIGGLLPRATPRRAGRAIIIGCASPRCSLVSLAAFSPLR